MRRLLLIMLSMLLVSAQLLAQNRTITGKVTDAQGNGIPNASVMIKGASAGTTTDTDGSFSLSVPANAKTLIITSVGFENREFSLTNTNNVSIVLGGAQQAMDEVIVVAYGTTKRETFTGAATVIKSDEIGRQQISNISKSLEGLAPGITTTVGSGQPGSGAAIRIRGIGSINASQAPLYVVDGVPFGGDINSLNPNDVESISVLKDAASAALYGARGSNGVILITTKKGKGRTRFELQARYGINSRGVPEYDVIRDPGRFLEVYWQSLKAEAMNRDPGALDETAAGQYATDNLISKIGGYNPYNVAANQVIDPVTGKLNSNAKLLYNDNWEEALFENRPRQEYVGTLSGSSDKTRYYVSLGFLNDKGYVVKSDFRRVTGRINLEQEVNKWLRFGINGSYANSKSNTTQEGNTTYQNSFYFTRNVAPIYPVYLHDAQGNYVLDDKGNRQYDFGNGVMGNRLYAATENPRATLDLDIYNRVADNLSGRSFAEIAFLPELKLTLNYGIDLATPNRISFQNPLYGNAAGANGRGTVSSGRFLTNNVNQLLNYEKSFGDHSISALAGHESYKYTARNLSGSKENFLIPDNPQLGNGVSIQGLDSDEDTYAVEGYFGRVQYNYQQKYLLSGSFRRDGSSRFAPENRWGNFYSVGAGYIISKEKFFQNVSFLNMLKLKASYGLRGNDDLLYSGSTSANYYPYADQYTIVNNNGEIGLNFNTKGNRDITWEKNEDIDVGADFVVLNRISGTFDYFNRKTYDMLYYVPAAFSRGGVLIPTNVGDMKNWGWEAEINADIVKKKDFLVRLGLNATRFRNKITRLPEEFREKGLTSGNFKRMEGKSYYDYFMYRYAGVDPANGEALYYKDEVDANGDTTGKIITVNKAADATKYYLGKSPLHDIAGGVNLYMEFKGFDFSVLTSYALGGYVYDAPYASLMYAGGGDVTTWHKDIFNAWTPANTNTDIPKVQENYQEANSTSDRFLIDASYFSIRNISLGYTLPKSMTDRFKMGTTRFYVVADNVWLSSKRKGLDPRQDFNGSVYNAYSPIRTISVGLNTSF